ncbi:MAG: signal recognition particle protein [Candidatus Aenigmarchaeota archaeon]|nr:signal recognition particle protein [Candidatus Aenigmarchaeota archaeon]
MVDLSEKLRNLMGKISSLVSFSDKEIDEIVKDLQRTLLQADVDVDLVFELSGNIRKKAKKDPEAGISKKEYITKLIYNELVEILGGEEEAVNLEPHSILLLGLFGSGKTSLAGKLANFYKSRGMEVVVIGCDFSRPAAFEQLKQVADSIKVPIISGENLKNAKKELEKQKANIIIIDSAGRDALDKDMTKELKEIDSLFAPEEKYLVIPAELGQDARRQAEEFKKSINITGVVVTKMDSTAKGGATLTACKTAGAKIRFLGVGEKVTDLENYDPTRFVSRLLGFGDLQGLLDKFKMKEEEAKKIAEGELDLNTFHQQITEMQKQGSMKKMLDMIPGFGSMKLPEGAIDVGEEKMKKWKYVIDSMTKEEREQPEILKSSRVERIAKGSGTKVQEVNELISNFKKMKKMMKKMNPNKMKKFRGMGDIARMFGG